VSRPLSLLVVLLVVAATLHGALFGGLVYDDLRVIAGNSAIDHPASWRATLAEPLWGPTFPHWRPLTQLLLALAYSSGGAVAVHVLALALHLGAVGIAWRIAHQLLEPRAAALVALAFGVHAVQAESVAWAAALNDPLWGLGALLAIDAHLRAGPQRMAPVAVLGVRARARGEGDRHRRRRIAGCDRPLALARLGDRAALAAPVAVRRRARSVVRRARARVRRPRRRVRSRAGTRARRVARAPVSARVARPPSDAPAVALAGVDVPADARHQRRLRVRRRGLSAARPHRVEHLAPRTLRVARPRPAARRARAVRAAAGEPR
jgi:hypothetical protein